MWNARNATEIHLPRTTNNVESWHKNLQSALNCKHPVFSKLVEQLQLENVRSNAIAVKLHLGEDVPLYSSNTYLRTNRQLLNLIDRYGQPEYPLNAYLDAVSHYVLQLD